MGLRNCVGGSCWILLQLIIVALAISSTEVAAQQSSECLRVMFAVAGVSDNQANIYVALFQSNGVPASILLPPAKLTLRFAGISGNTDRNRIVNCFNTTLEDRTTACKAFKICSGHGTCQLSGLQHTCVCRDNYVGSLCSEHVCQPNNCKNGAGCTADSMLARGFKCTCPAGYTGDLCDVKLDHCQTKPCLNGGKCKSGEANYACTCAVGYKGTTCDVKWLTEAVIARLEERLEQVVIKEQHSSRGRVYYRLYLEKVNWETARTRCIAHGGELATIRSAGEQARAERARRPTTSSVWVGATDSATERTWLWTSNERLGFIYWDVENGQPDNGSRGDAETEDCLALRGHGHTKWNDADCDLLLTYLCEFAE